MPPAADKETGILALDWLDHLVVLEFLDDKVLLQLSPAELQIVKVNVVREIQRSHEIKDKLRKIANDVASKYSPL